MNEDGTINDGWPKFFKVDDWGPNMHHEDVNTLDFDSDKYFLCSLPKL